MRLKNLLKTNKEYINKIGHVLPSIRNLSYFSTTLITGFSLIVIILLVLVKSKSHQRLEFKENIASYSTEAQLSFLNSKTPLDLSYNIQVEKSIQYLLENRKADLELYLTRSEFYFPIIESYLDRYNLPLELKYLAVAESGLNPRAKSESGAVGIWQFLYNTCALLDIEVNSYIDERCDPYKATDAACRYLQYLYRSFNNWELAMAAYNGGPGLVKKAIERSGGKTTYWEIQKFLPKETANYVPTIIAINYIFENAEYNMLLTHKTPTNKHTDIDTIRVYKPLKFEQISAQINISVEELSELNPIYTKNFIPELKGGAILVLPKAEISHFLKQEKKIYAQKINKKSYADLNKNAGDTKNKSCITHIVKPGEFFHKLAMKYNCSIESIKAWNNIDSNDLHPGQKLKIWIENEI